MEKLKQQSACKKKKKKAYEMTHILRATQQGLSAQFQFSFAVENYG